MDGKTRKIILIRIFLAVIIVSLYFAYQNGTIGKAIVSGISG